jgi:hypothetical protein
MVVRPSTLLEHAQAAEAALGTTDNALQSRVVAEETGRRKRKVKPVPGRNATSCLKAWGMR